jgi:hypothetical protein
VLFNPTTYDRRDQTELKQYCRVTSKGNEFVGHFDLAKRKQRSAEPAAKLDVEATERM